MELMGKTKPEIAAALAFSIPARSTVFVPEEECHQEIRAASLMQKAALRAVPKVVPKGLMTQLSKAGAWEFEENIRIALAVARFLRIKDETAFRGIAKARPDFGSLKLWKVSWKSPPCSWILASAFAANEPESSRQVLEKLEGRIPLDGRKMIALLNFREDRGDRTRQWLRALEEGWFARFERVVLSGAHGPALKKRMKRWPQTPKVSVILDRKPEKVMEKLFALDREAILVGMGNMGGLGKALVEHWDKIGESYGI
jgi:poly-gamma-glutamate synthase PgsB/CapB